jgi:GntR family transcriptional regulator/MocR family aminotransferase
LAKGITTTSFAALELDSSLETPLYRQLYIKLRQAILAGQLPAGMRLPSTRTLALELNISRNTVINAFDQLLAEGYLEGRVGAGTFVACVLPEDLLHVEASRQFPQNIGQIKGRRLSQRGSLIQNIKLTATTVSNLALPRAFRPGLPSVEEFPFDVWAKLAFQHWQQPPMSLLSYADPAGYAPLREAIASYLWAMRGVRCTVEQVVIVSGSQQALDLAARVLLDPGDVVCLEDPGYLGARSAFVGAAAQVVPVPVDNEGIQIPNNSTARLVYVTPSHQYPLGVTMSLSRRLALLEWANQCGAWILEDDYDSEYRYSSRPLAALQGLDNEGRVIYFGTFSKVLFPSLRLGYLVVPPDLVAAFVAARATSDRHSPSVEQAVLADFMAEGHFGRHIRRTRLLYASRQQALVTAAQRELGGLLEVCAAEAGMHLLGWLPSGIADTTASEQALKVGVEAPALSNYALKSAHLGGKGGLLLGYAAFNAQEIDEAILNLKRVLQHQLDPRIKL